MICKCKIENRNKTITFPIRLHSRKEVLDEKKYEHWFTVYGVDTVGKKCVEAKVQAYLRLRN